MFASRAFACMLVLAVALSIALTGCGAAPVDQAAPAADQPVAEQQPVAEAPTAEPAQEEPTVVPTTEAAPVTTTVAATTTEAAPAAVASTEDMAYDPMMLGEANLTVDVPRPWLRFGTEKAWGPDREGAVKVGITWKDLQEGQEIEAAMIPEGAEMLGAESITTALGEGNKVHFNVTSDKGATSEVHVLVIAQEGLTRRAYDIYGAAATAEDLAVIEPVVDHMVESLARS